MKCDLRLQSKYYLLLVLLLFLAAVILSGRGSKIWIARQMKNANNNPQDFFLWATNSSFSYSFRYDPRAADEWLFHSGTRLIPASMPPRTVINSTN